MTEYINCEHCRYFTRDVPKGVFKPWTFNKKTHGACVGCPYQPDHVEHQGSARCAWFVLREDLVKERR